MQEMQNLRGNVYPFHDLALNGTPAEVKGNSVKSAWTGELHHLDLPLSKRPDQLWVILKERTGGQ
jgi:hypothetical protein